MVILICAISSVGKTLMAQQLLEKYHIPYLSADHLKMGLYRGDAHCGFTPSDDTEVIAEKLWPIIKGIIMTNIENNQSIIIEGCYMLPQYMNDFEKSYSEKIIPIFMGFSTKYIKENFTSHIVKHRNVIEARMYPEERNMSDFIKEQEAFKRKCEKYGVAYFEIDEDYHQDILKVYEYIEMKEKYI
ncbi:2-phosphoglycerate kinase [Bacillus sp. AGMB 02131]|uniref:2-phosphoglycerate kinase n=1 Tax=Peribacillus faecalis TaxID=2772559 RepID=A0A927CUL3_9BACI|nr:2-phosphoglycerate kinase [Peribacillus faecalis]MBD3107479.1 2-phosphoglycerate kinase [Peribacillus faecalis]